MNDNSEKRNRMLKANTKLKNWFHQVLLNRHMDKQCSGPAVSTDTLNHSENASHHTTLDSLLAEFHKKRYLKRMLQSLDPKERVAIILHYYQKLPRQQVAEILGITVNTLENLFYRVFKKLQSKIEKITFHKKWNPLP